MITVQPINTQDPNALWAEPLTVSQFGRAQISHSLAVHDLGLNIPVQAAARTSFRFQTGDAGDYEWRCEVACAIPSSGGHSASMATPGYMLGKLVSVE